MSRHLIKSVTYTPTRQRFALHANFRSDKLEGYSITILSSFDPNLSGPEADDYETEVEHFLAVEGGDDHKLYLQASLRFRDLVLPLV